MISQEEIRRIAGALGVEPTVIDHDYVLGVFLYYLMQNNNVRHNWIFKGGTALAKCYFDDYRFSEDLDFTCLTQITKESLLEIMNYTCIIMQRELGIASDAEKIKVETIEDDYGKESFEAKIYYCGPLEYRGSMRSIRVHINRDELLIYQPINSRINHNYSDMSNLPPTSIQVYAIEEIIVEKLRAVAAQRKFPIARDIFDMYFLSNKISDFKTIKTSFKNKCAIKGISVSDIDINDLMNREEEYLINLENNLIFLIPKKLKVPFEQAWRTTIRLLELVLKNSN